VTTPDFEIRARLRARTLTSREPPDARTKTNGENLTVTRQQTRSGLPAEMRAGERYEDVVVDKRLSGEVGSELRLGGSAQPRTD
jgi:hypothetical protein